MLGLISPKKEYYYVAKWISNDDRNKTAYFRFKIVNDHNTDRDMGNMSGTSGDAMWETLSNIDFQPEDICIFRNDRFTIKNIKNDKKAKADSEKAYINFTKNNNLVKQLTMYKANMYE